MRATTDVLCVFVIDTSGSMHTQMPTVRQMLRHRLTADILDCEDEIALVQFATNAHAADEANENAGLGPLTAERQKALLAFVNGLNAGGNTNLSTGVIVGLERLKHARPGNTRCLCILTDGRPYADLLLEVSGPYSQALLGKVQAKAPVGSVNVFPIGFQSDIHLASLSDLAAKYNSVFECVVTIYEAKRKCEDILGRMKFIVTRDLTLRAEVSEGTITDNTTSCELHSSGETHFEVFIVDQDSDETPRDVSFTLVPLTSIAVVAYTLSFMDVPQGSSKRTLTSTVTLPHPQLQLMHSEVYHDAVNRLHYIKA